MKRSDKKALSPVVATVLLVAMVIFIALIVFLWLRGVVGEYGEKFGKNVEIVCGEVKIDAGYTGGSLYVTNDGNVPIFNLNLRLTQAGSYQTKSITSLDSSWKAKGLTPGSVFTSQDISSTVGSSTSLTVIPILIATSDSGQNKAFTCDEQYGQEIILV